MSPKSNTLSPAIAAQRYPPHRRPGKTLTPAASGENAGNTSRRSPTR
jgi:hypothetical protein